MYQLLAATEIQVAAAASSMGKEENLFVPPRKLIEKTYTLTRLKGFSGHAYGSKELGAYMRLLDDQDPSYRN